MANDTTDSGTPSVSQHKNDMYGNIDARSEQDEGVQAAIPAATVVLLRDAAEGVEALMLRKNSKITFGGMWVFPGGKIDAEDDHEDRDHNEVARYAAARETLEETGLVVQPDEFEWFAHWTPPPGPQKRFATWFFAVSVDGLDDVIIDDGEIKDHAWITPTAALARHTAGEIDLVPPTWVTLYHLSNFDDVASALRHFHNHEAKIYQTRVAKNTAGDRVAMWQGDAGYDTWDATIEGPRHRLTMSKSGFIYQT